MVSLEDLFTKPRKSVASYGEVLPWFGMVGDGLVLCHDGSLIAGFSLEGDDLDSITDGQINLKIDYLQNAMRQFNDRITVWFIQSRRYAPGYEYADYAEPLAEYIDKMWGEALERSPNAKIEHRIYVGFSYPNKAEAFFEELKGELEASSNGFSALIKVTKKRLSDKSAISSVRGRLADMADEFEQTLGNFAGLIQNSLGFVRLKSEDLLGDLYSRANLASPSGPISLPLSTPYLNTILPADDVVRQGDFLEFKGPVESVFCAALSTTVLPKIASSSHIDQLLSMPCEYVMVQTFKFLDRSATETIIRDSEQFYINEVKSVMTRVFEQLFQTVSTKVNTGNLLLADDAQSALADMTVNELDFGYFNLTILALGATQKDATRSADVIATRLRSSGYSVTRERQGLFGAVLGCLPGNSSTQLRKYLVSVNNIADLAPTRTISTGESSHPFFGEVLGRRVPPHVQFQTNYGVRYGCNLHASDLGHTVVVGGSGSGKTSLMQLFVSQFQKYEGNTYIFDKDRSMALLTVLLNGAHIDLNEPAKSGIRMNPVKRMLSEGDHLPLANWVSVLMSSTDDTLTPEQSEKVSNAIQKLSVLSPLQWRLGTLYELLKGVDQGLARKLAPYIDQSETTHSSYGKGVYSDYFDNEEDDFQLGTLICMETGKLLDTESISAPFMDYAFYCIEKSLDGVTPTFIYIEEAWYMLANPKFEEKINDWLRTFRKKKAFVTFATQSPIELQKLKSWAAFISNVPTLIFMRSIKDSVEQLAPLYRSLFSMTDNQLSLLSSSIPRQDALIIKPGVTRLISAPMPNILIAINNASSREGMVERAKAFKKEVGLNWELIFCNEVLNVDF